MSYQDETDIPLEGAPYTKGTTTPITDEQPSESETLPSALPIAAPTLNPTIGTLAALGVTLDETTVCLLENVSGYYRLIGWSRRQREAGAALTQDAAPVCREVGLRLDRALWNEETHSPFLLSPDPVLYPPLEHFSVGVSPRPRMRVQLLGVSQEGLHAARQALASAPLHLTGMIQLHPTLTSSALATKLIEDRPEAMIIVGGYDNPDPATHSWLYTLCRLTGQALSRLSPSARPVVYYAGNRWAAEGAEALLQPQEGPLLIQPIGNVLPYPGHVVRTELPVVLSQLYWQLCQRMPGFAQLSRWVTAPGHVANLEATFAKLIQIWMEYHGLPRLHGLYCTPHWWLHVWAEATTAGIQMRFVKPNSRLQEFAKWPPLQLVCGPWPRRLWSPPQRAWWDQHALAPLITTIGQVAPQAMIQTLEEDVLETR